MDQQCQGVVTEGKTWMFSTCSGSQPSPTRTKVLTLGQSWGQSHRPMASHSPTLFTKWNTQQHCSFALERDTLRVDALGRQCLYCSRMQSSTDLHLLSASLSCQEEVNQCWLAQLSVQLQWVGSAQGSWGTRYWPQPRSRETTKGWALMAASMWASSSVPSPRRTKVLTLMTWPSSSQLVMTRKVPTLFLYMCRKRQPSGELMWARQTSRARGRQYQYLSLMAMSTLLATTALERMGTRWALGAMWFWWVTTQGPKWLAAVRQARRRTNSAHHTRIGVSKSYQTRTITLKKYRQAAKTVQSTLNAVMYGLCDSSAWSYVHFKLIFRHK